jgi:7,8-dihydro-6-hydroxymethylpterin dimethyltransferase
LAKLIRNTYSVCPVCLGRLPAEIVKDEQDYYLHKTCQDHGRFSTIVWRGDNPSFEHWGNYAPPPQAKHTLPDCPNACGLCPGHLQKSCCVLVEVTARCNLNCPFCFAQSGRESPDPTLECLSESFKDLIKKGCTFIQLSGGEPTLRDDLPSIIAAARSAGCENIQLNSNGIRLGEDRAYTRELAQAGLSFVFMQFDGTEDAIYKKLRGRPLFEAKKAAIQACSNELLGVTLVPTVVPGINDHNLGELLNFAFSNSPAVRGVHFQPVSYFGRHPQPTGDENRMTLPDLLRAIEQQTNGAVRIADLAPSGCDHPRCGFHGDFVVLSDGLIRLAPEAPSCCGSQKDRNAHIKNRNFVARRWKRAAADNEPACCNKADFADMDTFLGRIKTHGFTITAMAFQDAYTFDIERLRQCSLHVYAEGRLIPFCTRYLTAEVI